VEQARERLKNVVLQRNMTSAILELEALTDDQLLDEVKRLARRERVAIADLLRCLIEVDTRRLYLREGCASLFTYCTQVLHLAEGAPYNRIETARAARRFPILLERIADGSLTLTSARLLAPHLTAETHDALLDAARHKGKRDIELLIATLRPRPRVRTVLTKVRTAQAVGSVTAATTTPSISAPGGTERPPAARIVPPHRRTDTRRDRRAEERTGPWSQQPGTPPRGEAGIGQ